MSLFKRAETDVLALAHAAREGAITFFEKVKADLEHSSLLFGKAATAAESAIASHEVEIAKLQGIVNEADAHIAKNDHTADQIAAVLAPSA